MLLVEIHHGLQYRFTELHDVAHIVLEHLVQRLGVLGLHTLQCNQTQQQLFVGLQVKQLHFEINATCSKLRILELLELQCADVCPTAWLPSYPCRSCRCGAGSDSAPNENTDC